MDNKKSQAGKLGAVIKKQQILEAKIIREQLYNQHPKCCKYCAIYITYKRFHELEKEGEVNYCSRNCSASATNKKRLLNKIQIVKRCVYCNLHIDNVRKDQVACSHKCFRAYQNKIILEKFESGENFLSIGPAKRLLIKKFGNKCQDPNCVWDFEKRPVLLELEHIDGNYKNNSINNLKLLCPNCHTFTSTYKSKNRGNGRAYRIKYYLKGM